MQANLQWAANQEGATRVLQTPMQDDALGEPVYKRMRTQVWLASLGGRAQGGTREDVDGCKAVAAEATNFRRCAWCGQEVAVHVITKWGEMCAGCDETYGTAMELRPSFFAPAPTGGEVAAASPAGDGTARGRGNADTLSFSQMSDADATAIASVYHAHGLEAPRTGDRLRSQQAAAPSFTLARGRTPRREGREGDEQRARTRPYDTICFEPHHRLCWSRDHRE